MPAKDLTVDSHQMAQVMSIEYAWFSRRISGWFDTSSITVWSREKSRDTNAASFFSI